MFPTVPEKPQVSAKWLEDLFVARVSWTLKVKNGVIKEYHVTYTREDDSSDRQMNSIEDKEIDFKNLKGGKTYKFEVCSKESYISELIGTNVEAEQTLCMTTKTTKAQPLYARLA